MVLFLDNGARYLLKTDKGKINIVALNFKWLAGHPHK